MSTNTISRLPLVWKENKVPLRLGYAAITVAVTSVALAALILLTHHVHIPSPFSQLDKLGSLNNYATYFGLSILGVVASCTAFFAIRRYQTKRAPIARKDIYQLQKFVFAVVKKEQLEKHEKLYFDLKTQLISEDKKKIPYRRRLTLEKIGGDKYLVKTRVFLSKGGFKVVYIEWLISKDEIKRVVRSKEVIKPKNSKERKILQSPSLDKTYIVQLLKSKKRTMVFAFCKYGELWQAKNQCSAQEILQLYRDYFLGLNDLHEKNIIHGDLSPRNLFVTEEKGIKKGVIGDFGLSYYEASFEKKTKEVKQLLVLLLLDLPTNYETLREELETHQKKLGNSLIPEDYEPRTIAKTLAEHL